MEALLCDQAVRLIKEDHNFCLMNTDYVQIDQIHDILPCAESDPGILLFFPIVNWLDFLNTE